jgi:hypothetical protein
MRRWAPRGHSILERDELVLACQGRDRSAKAGAEASACGVQRAVLEVGGEERVVLGVSRIV